MKKKEWKEILKKCFGKEKDDRYHAVAMLMIYGVFFLILIVFVRLGGNNSMEENKQKPNVMQTPTPIPTENLPIENEPSIHDINYSYSYTISYNAISEIYLGKKIDEKEKFTQVKEGVITNYAILNDNYLILENDKYHITENPSRFFKYCDVERILLLIADEIPITNETTTKYQVSNKILSTNYHDQLVLDNEQINTITLWKTDNLLKKVELNLSNYLTAIDGVSSSLIIQMEFTDIGTTEDFELPM